jgi:2,5-diketo-D-gluconate reductase A
VLRKDLFIASKISDESNAGYDGVRRLVNHQLSLLQTDYVDLYMLHSPLPLDIMRETWKALEEMVDEGKIRVLGVSNFDTGRCILFIVF